MPTTELAARAAAAADELRDIGRRTVLVLADDDTDGLTSAAQLAIALRRAGLAARIRLLGERDPALLAKALAEPDTLVVTADFGSSQLDIFRRAGRPAVILDHHVPSGDSTGERIHHLNAHSCFVNGTTEACGATITFALVEALDAANRDLAGLALAGAWGDRHYSGDFHGYNARLAQRAESWGVARRVPGPRISEEPLVDAFSKANDPLVPGVRSHEEAERFARECRLDPAALPSALDEAERERLATALALRLLGIGCAPAHVASLLLDRWDLSLPDGRRFPAGTLSSLLNGAAKEATPADGLAFLLGEAEAARRVSAARETYRARLRAGLAALEAAGADGGVPLLAIDAEAYTGSVGSLGLRWVVPRAEGVTIWAPRRDGHAKLSLRLGAAIADRVNLAPILREVAREAGGYGGGHTLAAGAVVPAEAVGTVHEAAWRRVREEARRVETVEGARA